MATPFPNAQEFAKANERFDEADKEIKEIYQEIKEINHKIEAVNHKIEATNHKIEATNQEIKEVNQEIKEVNHKSEAFTSSNEYKAVAKHFAWGKPIPGTSEEDKALWCYFQFQLDQLNQEKQSLNKTIEGHIKTIECHIKTIEGLNQSKEDFKEMIKDLHMQTAAAFKKADTARKRYKHEAAVTKQRQLLTSVAHFLRGSYKFQLLYEKSPTFGDVMKAANFLNKEQVRNHFRSSKSQSTGTVSGPIQEFFTEDQWYTLLDMNYRVNRQLHGTLSDEYVVLESESSAKIVEEICQLCNFDNMDIKNADSDSASDQDSL